MNHEHYQELVSLYFDNALNDTECAELFAHLSRCAECRSLLRTTGNIRTLMKEDLLPDTSASLDRKVLGEYRQLTRAKKKEPLLPTLWFTRISIPLPAAASIVFLLIFTTLLISPVLFLNEPKSTARVETIRPLPPQVQDQLRMMQ
ncbi:MAG: zf-HC2 domain-containing protein [bacterium]